MEPGRGSQTEINKQPDHPGSIKSLLRPIHIDLRIVQFGQIGAACPVGVEAHPIDLDPFYKGVRTERCPQCRSVSHGLLQVDAEAIPRTRLVPVVEGCPFVYWNGQLASNLVKSAIVALICMLCIWSTGTADGGMQHRNT